MRSERQTFTLLGGVLILTNLTMLGVSWLGSRLMEAFLRWRDPAITAHELQYLLYEEGISLIAAALAALLPFALLRMQHVRERLFAKRRQMTMLELVLFFLMAMGLQTTAAVLTVPLEAIANLLGGSFYEASAVATSGSALPSMFVYSVLVAPVCEEVAYRGFVLETLRPYGKCFAIVTAAVLFGLMHGNIIQLPMAILVGLLLGYVATEYSLPAAIVLHAVNNLSVDAVSWLSMLNEEAAYAVDSAMLAFGILALMMLFRVKWPEFRAYCGCHRAERGTVLAFVTSPTVILLAVFLVFMTAISITPL